MNSAPKVISSPEIQQNVEAQNVEAQNFGAHSEQITVDRFPIGLISQQNQESEVLLLGSAPVIILLTIFATFFGIRLLRLLGERNEIGVNMRSSGTGNA